MLSINLSGKLYPIDDMYNSIDLINNEEIFNDKNEIFCNKSFEECKEPSNLFEVIPKITCFIENDDFNNDNIYFNQISKTNYNIKPNTELIFHIFKNVEKSNIMETKKSTKEPSFINDLKMKEISKDINNNNNKKRYNTKNMGRKRKNDIQDENSKKKIIHDKTKADNMRLKFKRAFIKNLIDFINFLIKNSTKLKRKGKIKKINSIYVNNIKKDFNLKMLDLTAKEFLSRDICQKCRMFDKDYNIKMIDYIYNNEDITLIEVLNKTIRELMKIFCSTNFENNAFKHFKRLNDYINTILIDKNHEKESYIQKFIYQALNFEQEYKKLDGRNENKYFHNLISFKKF